MLDIGILGEEVQVVNQRVPQARWTVTQPWRGLFGLALTVAAALIITASLSMERFGFVSYLVISCVPILAVTVVVWGGRYPPSENLEQPWRGMLLVAFVLLVGAFIGYGILSFMGAGVIQPYTNCYVVMAAVMAFWYTLAFDTWPFGEKMSLPARGFLSLAVMFAVAWLIMRLFNFSMLSYPTGVNPSPIGAVPLYGEGGPLAAFGHLVPHGPLPWEVALSYSIWSVGFLWMFVVLGMWPFRKIKMRQPLFGFVVVIVCLVLGYVALTIGMDVMGIEPIRLMGLAISYLFGVLMIINMFQMWPGRALKSPVAGGFANLALAAVLGIAGHHGLWAFARWHFATAMQYPNDILAVANIMLGLCFPMWAAYSSLFDFWPLPPTSASQDCETSS